MSAYKPKIEQNKKQNMNITAVLVNWEWLFGCVWNEISVQLFYL